MHILSVTANEARENAATDGGRTKAELAEVPCSATEEQWNK